MKAPRRKIFVWSGAALIAILALWAGLVYAANQAAPTRPLVTITGTFPEEAGVSGQPVVVFAQASNPDGVARTELWVNGQLVAAQDNPGEGLFPFAASQAWIPTGPGAYLIIVRAVDLKGFTGDSDPFLVQVYERQYGTEEETGNVYIAQEGDTIEDVAVLFGLSPEELIARNPGLGELSPGTTVDVPHVPEDDGGDAGARSGAGGEDIPRVDPPAPPPAPDEPAEEAEPLAAEWWTRVPLPANFSCLFAPESCRVPIEGHAPPFPAPDGLSVAPGRCFAELAWQDNSENEVGFRVYRFTMRPRFRFELVDLLAPSPGSGSRIIYEDHNPPTGSFFYAVMAYNSAGNTWSEPSEEITSFCPRAMVGPEALVVEGLEMSVAGSAERLYCYASLAGSPFERIPYGARNFIELDGAGGWDIAEHFSGQNKRTVLMSGIGPLTLVVECLGWQGDELTNLGRFERAHPQEEWDGRLLTAGPEGGGFTLTYRILPSFAAVDEGGRADWPLVDPGIEPPVIICARITPDDPCASTHLPGIYWVHPGVPRADVTAFKVYRRMEGGRVPAHYFTLPGSVDPRSAPLFVGDCGATVYYSVSAVLGVDPLTGEEIQSPLSDEFEVRPSCTTLEISLEFLWVYDVSDGDICLGDKCAAYEGYGWIDFNGQRILWNDHCDPGFGEGCITSGPSTTSVHEITEYSWSDMSLNMGDGWRQNNSVIRIPIRDGEALSFAYQLWDHDSGPDDLWCGFPSGRPNTLLEGRSVSEWEVFDEFLEYDDRGDVTTDLTGCILGFQVRGVPGE